MQEISLIILGFFTKLITGLDDTMTHVPVIASLTKRRMGKLAFSTGMLSAIITAIIIAASFSAVIKSFPYYRHVTALLLILLAIGIYFDVFVHKPRQKAEKKLLKQKKISAMRFTELAFIGYIASFATVLDDIVAYLPLFTGKLELFVYPALGIIMATLVEIVVVVYFSEKIAQLKYKEEIAATGLILLAVLLLFKAI